MQLTIQDALGKDKSQYPHALLRSIPPSYAFSSSSDRCLPGFLFCALGLRLNICHCLEANRSKSLLLISPSYFFFFCYTDLVSGMSRSINAPLWFSWGELCSDSPSCAPRLAACPCYSKGCWRGEAQVCVWCWVRAGLERILGKEIKSENKKETSKN